MKKIIALLVVVVLVVAGWSGGWMWGAGMIRDEIAALATADGETAPRVTCATTRVAGFPFRFDIECAGATILDRDVTTNIPGIRASVLAYHPTQVVFSTLGPVTVADAYSGGSWRLDYTAQSGGASLHTDDIFRGITGEGWRIGRVSLIADNLKLVDTVLGERPILGATQAEIQIIDMPDRLDPAAGTAALAGYARLAGVTAPANGVADGELTLEAELTGLPADLRSYDSATLPRFWQEHAGELKLVSLRGAAGEDSIDASGVVRLAAGSHVDGTVSLRTNGLVERFEASLTPEMKAVLLGQPAEDGSYSQTLNIKSGVVFVGLVPVAMIPPLSLD